MRLKLGMADRSPGYFDPLEDAFYVSVESYRKTGAAVRSPVNIFAEEQNLFCWTFGHSGKVKRIRRDPRVRLAKCDARGNIEGEWVAARARIFDDGGEEAKSLSRRIRGRHGLKYSLAIQLFRWYCSLRREPCLAIEFTRP